MNFQWLLVVMVASLQSARSIDSQATISVAMSDRVTQGFVNSWKPTFESFLNSQLNGSVAATFVLTVPVNSVYNMDSLVKSQNIDFYFCDPMNCACIEARYEAVPILTVDNQASQNRSNVLLSHASNSRISSIFNLTQAKFAFNDVLEWDAFLLNNFPDEASQLLSQIQTISTSSASEPLTDDALLDMLCRKEVDVVLVKSKSILSSTQTCFKVIFDEALSLTSSSSSRFDWRLLAFPYVDEQVVFAVQSSLHDLAYPHPAAVAGQYSKWTSAKSSRALSMAMQSAQLLTVGADGLARCAWQADGSSPFDAVACPANYYRTSQAAAVQNCADAGVACGAPACWCSPCQPETGPRVSLRQAKNTSRCGKMAACARVRQLEAFDLVLTLGGPAPPAPAASASFSLARAGDAAVAYGPAALNATGDAASISAQLQATGTYTLRAFLGGREISESPTLVEVTPAWCASGLVADEYSGLCTCAPGSVDGHGGSCVAREVIILAVVLPVAALVGAALLWRARRRMGKIHSAWLISGSEVEFDHPPVVIGHGAYGIVIRARYRGAVVAVKKAREREPGSPGKKTLTPSNYAAPPSSSTDISVTRTLPTWSQLLRVLKPSWLGEIDTLCSVRHPNIIMFVGVVAAEGEDHSEVNCMLVLEYTEQGSLHGLLHNPTVVVDEELQMSLAHDVVRGMRFLHAWKPPILHRDLKSSNVLVDSSFRAKISDFGALAMVSNQNFAGTPAFTPPELLVSTRPVPTTASDVYAFGVLLYELCSRRDPYEGQDQKKVLEDVVAKGLRPGPVSNTWPLWLREKMSICWAQEPGDRPSFEALDVELEQRRADESLQGFTSIEIADEAEAGQASGPEGGAKPAAGVVKSFGKGKKGGAKGREGKAWNVVSDMFPQQVASKLVRGEKVEDISRQEVTVFFSDIVGFTTICETLDASKVADMLRRLYERFDVASDRHGVFKVETIGDAYLATTNLVHDQESDHVARMARFAIECAEAASEIPIDVDDPAAGRVKIRAGFHTGPVVGSMVGNKYKKFSILGDTVNTASRMESHSLPGRVQCTHFTAQLLLKQDPSTELDYRGRIEVKGKGLMHTYLLRSRVVAAAEPPAPPESPVAAKAARDRSYCSAEL